MKNNGLMKGVVIVLAVIIVILLGVFFFYNPAQSPTTSTQPHPTLSADGDLQVTSLHDGDLIASPLTITGAATGGGWFNQATFPVKVADGDGRIIGTGIAQAQADWATTSSIPFTAIINFISPRYATGTVVFQKDDSSGGSADDATLSISVRFK